MSLPVPNPFLRPAQISGFGNMSSPGFERHRAVALATREQPGAWLDLDTGKSRRSAYGRLRVRQSPGILFKPDRVGSFEFRVVKRDDGYAVQVRYVRNSPESPAKSTPGSPSPAEQGAAADGEVPALSPAVIGAGTEQGGAA